MLLATDDLVKTMSNLEPMAFFAAVANALQCVALLLIIILIMRSHRLQRQQVEALQTLLLRGIQPEQVVRLAATLARLSETDVEDLLASRGRPPEAGSSIGSSPPNR